jgi:hypothetical protein
MLNTKRAVLAVGCGIAITAASALPVSYVDYTLWPGEIFAALFWPEGIHSDFSGEFSFFAMLATIWGVAALAWSVLVYAAASSLRKIRAA